MARDLSALVAPGRAAVVTSEIQHGVVGAASALPALAEAARTTMIPAAARLVAGARDAGVQVVHCTFRRRPDGRGTNRNARLFRAVAKAPVQNTGGTAVEVLPEVGVAPEDVVLTRSHGIGPMGGTDLDAVLRNLGITTVVVAGVSVNVAITNLVMDAVNHGYDVVLPRDAVAGVPAAYADALVDNTLALLATVTTVDDVVRCWKDEGGR